MKIKLSEQPKYDLDALLNTDNISVTNDKVVSATKTIAVSDTNAEAVSATNNPISDTNEKPISATKPIISDTKEQPISSTKISSTNGQKMNAWKKAHRDTIRIDVEKGQKEYMRDEAEKRGMSLTKLITEAVREYLENH